MTRARPRFIRMASASTLVLALSAPLALAPADPDRLGADAADWGSYYDSRPIVVAGRIALALEMVKRHG